MLRGIPALLPPELVKILMEMGHGDEIVFADRNFPAVSRSKRLVRCDGTGIARMLEAVAPFFPLDEAAERNVMLMKIPGGPPVPPVWEEYRPVLERGPERLYPPLLMDKADFYARSESAFAVVITGEAARFANVILRKGIVSADEAENG